MLLIRAEELYVYLFPTFLIKKVNWCSQELPTEGQKPLDSSWPRPPRGHPPPWSWPLSDRQWEGVPSDPLAPPLHQDFGPEKAMLPRPDVLAQQGRPLPGFLDSFPGADTSP